MPMGEPAIVIAFDAHTVVEQYEVKLGAKINKKIAEDLYRI